jgi:hypothetical protein
VDHSVACCACDTAQKFSALDAVVVHVDTRLDIDYCLLIAMCCLVLQAKRLEELDRLYREEVVSRKRAHNALQVGNVYRQ